MYWTVRSALNVLKLILTDLQIQHSNTSINFAVKKSYVNSTV